MADRNKTVSSGRVVHMNALLRYSSYGGSHVRWKCSEDGESKPRPDLCRGIEIHPRKRVARDADSTFLDKAPGCSWASTQGPNSGSHLVHVTPMKLCATSIAGHDGDICDTAMLFLTSLRSGNFAPRNWMGRAQRSHFYVFVLLIV